MEIITQWINNQGRRKFLPDRLVPPSDRADEGSVGGKTAPIAWVGSLLCASDPSSNSIESLRN
jgi:hypothetical protein